MVSLSGGRGESSINLVYIKGRMKAIKRKITMLYWDKRAIEKDTSDSMREKKIEYIESELKFNLDNLTFFEDILIADNL